MGHDRLGHDGENVLRNISPHASYCFVLPNSPLILSRPFLATGLPTQPGIITTSKAILIESKNIDQTIEEFAGGGGEGGCTWY